MGFNLDQVFGIHADALLLRAKRAEILASNLANADTPNYKARDINFKALLEQARGGAAADGGLPLEVTHADDLRASSAGLGRLQLLYRVPLQPSLDGNTVNAQVEEAAFAKNAVQYEASLTFLNDRIHRIMQALKGN